MYLDTQIAILMIYIYVPRHTDSYTYDIYIYVPRHTDSYTYDIYIYVPRHTDSYTYDIYICTYTHRYSSCEKNVSQIIHLSPFM